MEMVDILVEAVKQNASDIHIVIGKPPMVRINGDIQPLSNFPIMTPEESKRLIYSILYDEQKLRFEAEYELDCSIQILKIARFRVNVLLQKYGIEKEIGIHTKSFATALKYALRQDPDVILVGEVRDLETISSTLTVAETGYLVFATLHTQDAAQTVDRIIDVFPSHQQQVRIQLASTLKAVISQVLLPRKDTSGRVAAREIIIVTTAIANLIREGKTHQIYTAIETGAKYGMMSLDKSLLDLVRKGWISLEDAVS